MFWVIGVVPLTPNKFKISFLILGQFAVLERMDRKTSSPLYSALVIKFLQFCIKAGERPVLPEFIICSDIPFKLLLSCDLATSLAAKSKMNSFSTYLAKLAQTPAAVAAAAGPVMGSTVGIA